MALSRPYLAVPRTNDPREIRKWREGLSKWAVADYEGYVFYVKSSELDQGASTGATFETIRTMKDVISLIETTTYCTIVFIHNGENATTEYNFDTSLDLTNYPNVFLDFFYGAHLTRTTGDEVLTLYDPNQLGVSPSQKITSVDMIAFSMPGTVYAEWWGAVGDGATIDSIPAQYAVDALASAKGGVLQGLVRNYLLNITLPTDCSGITIRGIKPVMGYNDSEISGKQVLTQYSAAVGGAVIDTPATIIYNITIENIYFYGLGTVSDCVGVRWRYVGHSILRHCSFSKFSDQAFLYEAGGASEIQGNVAHDCLQGSHTSRIGAFEITAVADSFIFHNEISGGLSALSDSNKYYCAFRFGVSSSGGNNFIHHNVAEYADIGFYFECGYNRIMGNRADNNFAEGFYWDASGGNEVIGNFGRHNCKETDDTYNDFHQASGSADNCFIGNYSFGNSGGNQPKYGFANYAIYSDGYTNSTFIGNKSRYFATGQYYADDRRCSGFEGISVSPVEKLDNDPTPDVNGISFLILNYDTNTDVTDFENGTPGQMLYLLKTGLPGNVTIKNNANINTNTGADKVMTHDILYAFKYYWGAWYEVE